MKKVSRVPPIYKGLTPIWELDHGSLYSNLSLPMIFPSWAQKEAEDRFPRRRGKRAEGSCVGDDQSQMSGKGKGELLWISLLGAPIFFIICINCLTVKAPQAMLLHVPMIINWVTQ